MSSEESSQNAVRGFGPFTGRQLTFIIVTAILAVALPTGAYALGSSVMIQDGRSYTTANVTPAGAVQVAVADPVSIHTAAASLPTNGSWQSLIWSPGPSQGFVLTDIHVAVDSPSSHDLTFYISGSTCSVDNLGSSNYYDFVPTPAIGVIDLPISPGVVMPPGSSLCVSHNNNGPSVVIFGYMIPGSAIPAPAATTTVPKTTTTRPRTTLPPIQ